ncbi:GNAT family N-acetyltransferase [Niveibacterium terrae]|uniref:GNAT family N-acetyltransferase n=1 Tax=Niveibacterium terrae TaxID=3373598 RepID=UPI003A926ABD
MTINYSDTREFALDDLRELFQSVQWSSANYPDKLQQAMKNSDTVISAWDGEKLVGLINAMSDGVLNAYFPYLLVRPDYHSSGIGRQLVTTMLDRYRGFVRKTLVAYDHAVPFYQRCGFEAGDDKTPMFVTSLTS